MIPTGTKVLLMPPSKCISLTKCVDPGLLDETLDDYDFTGLDLDHIDFNGLNDVDLMNLHFCATVYTNVKRGHRSASPIFVLSDDTDFEGR